MFIYINFISFSVQIA